MVRSGPIRLGIDATSTVTLKERSVTVLVAVDQNNWAAVGFRAVRRAILAIEEARDPSTHCPRNQGRYRCEAGV
jgi:hypothetical protein